MSPRRRAPSYPRAAWRCIGAGACSSLARPGGPTDVRGNAGMWPLILVFAPFGDDWRLIGLFPNEWAP